MSDVMVAFYIGMIPSVIVVFILWGFIYQPLKEQPRDFCSLCLGVAMIAIVSLRWWSWW